MGLRKMMLSRSLGLALVLAFPTSLLANPCEKTKFIGSSAAHLAAGSIPNNELGDHLNASIYTHGIQFDIRQAGEDLQVDIIEFPQETQLAAGLFALLQVSRLAASEFDRLVLVDGDIELFSFAGNVARENGCQTLWGVNVEGSPMPLLVGIMSAAKDLENDALLVQYSGRWLADMNTAIGTFNEVIAPKWIYSAAK